MLSRRRVVLAVGLHQSTATATAGYLAVRRRWQRTTLPLGARVGGVVSTTAAEWWSPNIGSWSCRCGCWWVKTRRRRIGSGGRRCPASGEPSGRAAFRAREPRAVSPYIAAPPTYCRILDL